MKALPHNENKNFFPNLETENILDHTLIFKEDRKRFSGDDDAFNFSRK